MLYRHGFLHSTETNQNEPKHPYLVQKVDWVRSFHFWPEPVVHFVSGANRCIKCYIGMVFYTVTKLTKTNRNITIWSKKLDWVRSFRFWHESEVFFGSGPNWCLKCNIGMVFCTVTKLTKTSLLGQKKWIGCVRFVSGPNR